MSNSLGVLIFTGPSDQVAQLKLWGSSNSANMKITSLKSRISEIKLELLKLQTLFKGLNDCLAVLACNKFNLFAKITQFILQPIILTLQILPLFLPLLVVGIISPCRPVQIGLQLPHLLLLHLERPIDKFVVVRSCFKSSLAVVRALSTYSSGPQSP